jgi:hypothetical protein
LTAVSAAGRTLCSVDTLVTAAESIPFLQALLCQVSPVFLKLRHLMHPCQLKHSYVMGIVNHNYVMSSSVRTAAAAGLEGRGAYQLYPVHAPRRNEFKQLFCPYLVDVLYQLLLRQI